MLSLKTLSRSRSETQSHLSTQHATETQTHLPTQHRAPRQQSARASEGRQACDMDGLQCSRLKVAATTKIVAAGESPDPGASSHHRHDARRTFGPTLVLRVSVGACRTRSADTRSVLRGRLGKPPWSTARLPPKQLWP